MKKASRRGFSFLGAGIYVAFLMPFIGFVPYRYGYILLGPTVNADLPESVPTILSEFPFVNDLAFIGGYIASPSLLGNVIIGISIALTVVGLWNVGYLCFHHDRVISWSREKQYLTEYFVRGMPHFGAAAFLLFLALQWPNWPILQ